MEENMDGETKQKERGTDVNKETKNAMKTKLTKSGHNESVQEKTDKERTYKE